MADFDPPSGGSSEWTDTGSNVVPAGGETVGDGTTSGDFGPVSIESLSNVRLLPEIDGSTLNAKWDNLRSSFVGGESYAVLIPPPSDPSDPAVGEFPNGTMYWKVDAPLVFDNPENFGYINAFRSNIANEGAIDRFLTIGDTEKPENIDINGGTWRCKDGGATELARVKAGARTRFHGIKAGANAEPFVRGINVTAETSPCDRIVIRDMQGGVFDDASVILNGQSNAVNGFVVDQIRGSGDDVVKVTGESVAGKVEGVRTTITERDTPNSGVKLTPSSNGRPDNVIIEDVAVGTGPAVKLTDDTGGSAALMREITVRELSVQNNETVFSAHYCQGCDFDIGSTDLTWTISLDDVRDSSIDFDGPNVSVSETANGYRKVINGWGVNSGDPSSTGFWNGNGNEGLNVLDTSNDVKYLYRNGGWL